MAFEKRIDGQTLYEGVIVNVRLDRAELVNGDVVRREVVEHPGGVTVIPVEPDGTVWCVRQFRYPFGREMLETPAGKLEPGGGPRGVRRPRALGGDGADGGRAYLPRALLHLARVFHRGAAHIPRPRPAPRGDAPRPRRVPER